jgi:hypothetical protein
VPAQRVGATSRDDTGSDPVRWAPAGGSGGRWIASPAVSTLCSLWEPASPTVESHGTDEASGGWRPGATVSGGWVTLRGSVDRRKQRVDAERAVVRLAGIYGVINESDRRRSPGAACRPSRCVSGPLIATRDAGAYGGPAPDWRSGRKGIGAFQTCGPGGPEAGRRGSGGAFLTPARLAGRLPVRRVVDRHAEEFPLRVEPVSSDIPAGAQADRDRTPLEGPLAVDERPEVDVAKRRSSRVAPARQTNALQPP